MLGKGASHAIPNFANEPATEMAIQCQMKFENVGTYRNLGRTKMYVYRAKEKAGQQFLLEEAVFVAI